MMVNNWNIYKLVEENIKNEVDFVSADKCQIFPQIDAIALGVLPGMPKLPKISSLLFLCIILRKK